MCASQFGSAHIIQRLVDCGAAVDARDNDGSTSVHYAAEGGRADAVGALMDNGARGDFINHDGLTPLDLARYGNHVEVAEFLDQNVARAPIRDSAVRTHGLSGDNQLGRLTGP